jgi:branched-chain amino acid transport system permease protein
MEYILHILIFILIYSILVQSLNLIMGYAGIVSMCHAIFSGIGAYTAALMSIHLGYNFLVGTAVGFLLAGATGALLALPSLRVRDEYLIVFTIGFQMVMFELMLTARGITEGQGGIPNIPPPKLFGFQFQTPLSYLPLALAITAVCFIIARRVIDSPFGRVLKAIREDESACRALGKNSLRFKVLVFALGGGLAAVGGSTLAYYLTFISPFSFTVDVSIFIIVMVVMGGAANFWGPLVGAAILVGVPEALRFIPGTADMIDVLREILYGLILMLFMLFRPQGILPEYLGKRKKLQDSPALSPPEHEDTSFEDISADPGLEKSDPPPALELKRVSKSFGGLQAVNHVSLALSTGKITGLIGPNGCGKTTLFNLITGYLIPNEGTIHIHGKDMTCQPPYQIVKTGLARSWQDVRIFNGMTVLDNVLIACPSQKGENLLPLLFRPWRVVEEEKKNLAKASEYLKLVGLFDKADQLAASLSTAEQKLVAISRLLATECPILLLDEPTAALDFESVKRIIDLIRKIAQQGRKTILLVEHNLDVVRGLTEKTYFMSEGEILAYGQPSELMSDPKLAEVYFGVESETTGKAEEHVARRKEP